MSCFSVSSEKVGKISLMCGWNVELVPNFNISPRENTSRKSLVSTYQFGAKNNGLGSPFNSHTPH
jgi:hypothetical protein